MTRTSPLTVDEIAAVRKPYRAASLLPGRAYHDPAIFDFEREEWFRHDWVIVGREEDAAVPGTYFLAAVDEEPLIVVRGRDEALRGFYNVCRHRGTAVVEEPCGKAVRFQCPYHAWIYDLDGRLVRAKHTDDLDDFSLETFGLAAIRVETWQGFVFASLDPDAQPLREWLGDLVPHLERFDLGALRVAHTETYEVAANWKFIAENYSECYHCPGIHPQLNKLTPYDLGGDFAPDGPWQGGWMELVDDAETMALAGGHRAGRPAMAGITELDDRRVYYYLVWPSTFIFDPPGLRPRPSAGAGCRGAYPDRLRVAVRAVDDRRARFRPVRCDRVLGPDEPAGLACLRLQQRGTRSRSWVAGRYSNQEPSVHAFDLMCVDRYADDGVGSRRTVRSRYDVPPPKDDPAGIGDGQGDVPAILLPRSAATAGARTSARARARR